MFVSISWDVTQGENLKGADSPDIKVYYRAYKIKSVLSVGSSGFKPFSGSCLITELIFWPLLQS
jgi:hypothetical protein